MPGQYESVLVIEKVIARTRPQVQNGMYIPALRPYDKGRPDKFIYYVRQLYLQAGHFDTKNKLYLRCQYFKFP